MRVGYHKKFIKLFSRLPENIKIKFSERLLIFEQDKFHPLLNNHSVESAYPGWWSINVTGDFRALYDPIADDAVVFMKIGTHSELYG